MNALLKKANKNTGNDTSKGSNTGLLKSSTKIYFVEYVMSLISLGGVIVASSWLFMAVTEYFLGKPSSWLSRYQLTSTITAIVSLVVFMMLLYVFLSRVKNTDKATGYESHGRLLSFIRSLFLIALLVSVAISVITVLATLANQLVSINVPGESDKWRWMMVLNGLFVGGISLYSFLYFYYQAGRASSSKFLRLAYRTKTFLTKLTVLSIVLILLAIFFPVRQLRGIMIDEQISNDISVISSAVNSLYYKDYVLPKSLDDVELEKAVKARKDSFTYTYSAEADDRYVICANFKTDTTKDNYYGFGGGVVPMVAEDLKANTSSASPMIYPPVDGGSTSNPYSHKAGKDCFTYSVYYYPAIDMPASVPEAGASSGSTGIFEDSIMTAPAVRTLEFPVSEN